MSDVTDVEASVLDFFVALHDLVWHYKGGENTSDLTGYLSSPSGASNWRDSVIYATRFRPSLDNTRAEYLTSVGSVGPGLVLTASQGHQAAQELVSFHNTMGSTAVWWFAQYLDSDPAAWADWLGCVQRAL